MTMSNDVLLAILALDSYNRGYGAGVVDEGASDQDGLGETGNIAGMTLITRADLEISAAQYDAWKAASFYAVAYQDASGNIVISYRGTDDPTLGADLNAWAGGAGWETEQAELAARFCRAVRQANPAATFTHSAQLLH